MFMANIGVEGACLRQRRPPRQCWPCGLQASCGLFSEEGNVGAELRKCDAIADLGTLASDPSGDAPAAFEFNDRKLVGYVVHVGFGWREDDGFGVDGAWPQFVHAAPRMVMTLVAPEPPRFCASPIVFRLTCRSPASPRICWTTSQICPTPVAPTGWPFDFSPPLVLMGSSPLMHVRPASV